MYKSFFNSLEELQQWEIRHSSLSKIHSGNLSYEDCRNYSCEDIVNNMTKFTEKLPFIVEIPESCEFHFIGRVDTTYGCQNRPKTYYNAFKTRNFISFSTINNRNISHYKNRPFFVYNILPSDIVHVFPIDSDTDQRAKSEQDLTILPSLWLTLQDLNDLTLSFKVYDQITCKTKRNGRIVKPFAIIAFNSLSNTIISIAKDFGISCIIVHPDKEAINYDRDLLYDYTMLNSISCKLEKSYNLSVIDTAYLD